MCPLPCATASARMRTMSTSASTIPSTAPSINYIPDTGDIPLVADMSSCILSEPVDVTKFGADLCRRAEEHGARRADRRHRPRRPASATRAPKRPPCSTTRLHGGQRLHVQHAPLLLPSTSAGLVLRVDCERHGRPGRNEGAQREEGAVLYDYLDSAATVQGARREGVPLA